jgi:ABC-2 type transport system ATP-binding protein
MDEAENCDHIAIIDHGKIQAIDTPANLKRTIGGDTIVVGGDDGLPDELQAKYGVAVQKTNGEYHFQMQSGAEFVPRIVGDFAGRIRSIQVKQPSLEDVFLKLTGRAIRDQEGSALDSMRQNVQLWRRGRR